MGYGYGINPRTGREALACDGCGESEGRTRKRTCRFRVTHHPGPRSTGGSLPYCPAPAYCPDCYAARGGAAGVHPESCREGAQRAQERNDREAARLATGDARVASAWGSWHGSVPDGYAGVLFVELDGTEHYRLIESEAYDERSDERGLWLTDYPDAHPWAGPAAVLEDA